MSTTKIRLWRNDLEKRERAIQYRTTPPGRDGRMIWVPRSIIEHSSELKKLDHHYTEVQLTLPDWFVEKENL